MYFRRAGGRRQRRPQPADQDERRGHVAQLHLEQLQRVDLVDPLGPAVDAVQVGHQAAGVDRASGRDPLRRRRPGDQRQRGQRVRRRRQWRRGSGQRRRPARPGAASGTWPKVSSSGSGPVGQRLRLGRGQRRVGAGRAAHRLRGVVDQDVQRALLGDRVGQRHHLRRVAQVDADDPQPVQPVGAVRHRGEPADRVVREPGGDGGVRAVAQQPQRDVHADLGPAAGEQRAPAGQVGAGVALGVADRRAVGAELVVERVHLGVALLADVAGPRPDQGAGDGAGRGRHQREALRSRRRSGPARRSRSPRSPPRRPSIRRAGGPCGGAASPS